MQAPLRRFDGGASRFTLVAKGWGPATTGSSTVAGAVAAIVSAVVVTRWAIPFLFSTWGMRPWQCSATGRLGGAVTSH